MFCARVQMFVPALPVGKLGNVLLGQLDRPLLFVAFVPRVTCGITPPATPLPPAKSLNRCTPALLNKKPVLNVCVPRTLVKLSMIVKNGELRPWGSNVYSGVVTETKLILKARGKGTGGRKLMLGWAKPVRNSLVTEAPRVEFTATASTFVRARVLSGISQTAPKQVVAIPFGNIGGSLGTLTLRSQ